jgi:hypothetical protein
MAAVYAAPLDLAKGSTAHCPGPSKRRPLHSTLRPPVPLGARTAKALAQIVRCLSKPRGASGGLSPTGHLTRAPRFLGASAPRGSAGTGGKWLPVTC